MLKCIVDVCTDDTLKCYFINVKVSVINGLRRSLLRNVPTIAIDRVEFARNDQLLNEDIMRRKLHMLPIHSKHVDSMIYGIDCTCEDYCDKCAVTYELNVSVPENGVLTDVYAGEFMGSNPLFPIQEAQDIQLTSIRPTEGIRLLAIATKGVARVHAKWSPIIRATHWFIPKVFYGETLSPTVAESIVASCPHNVLCMIGEGHVDIEDAAKCTFCGKCTRPDTFRVAESDTVLFTVETTQVMTPLSACMHAIEALRIKFEFLCLESISKKNIGDEEKTSK